ncbi:winged helix-turn-helix transcriptional regulator [Nocardia testacea]|uniref:winged helix-turn-helix transcriptional regulator n=1 Tax=Nocardia testacea TaxID=248551 RepID=UPI003C2D4893
MRDRLISRRAHPVAPARVEYALSPRGASRAVVVHAMADRVRANHPDILRSRAQFGAGRC